MSENDALPLVPRGMKQGYSKSAVDARRRWIEERAGVTCPHLQGAPVDTESMRGNIENPIGFAQVPVGLAGPLRIAGRDLQDLVYVPMATTEGALIRSYERGMVVISQAGGATTALLRDENEITPCFSFERMTSALEFVDTVRARGNDLMAAADATTRHGRCLGLEPIVFGSRVYLRFRFHTGDAHGMNMIARAADAACQLLCPLAPQSKYELFSGLSGEKRPGGLRLQGGKGKTVVADAQIPGELLRRYLRVDADDLEELWHQTVVGNMGAAALGYTGHAANALAAIFIACGQDVANVANAALGVTEMRSGADGSLHISVTLPSLTVATVGGGTALGTAQECLSLMGCLGKGRAPRLAQIVAGTVLAGELSMAAALASGEFVQAHERYGRNRPVD